MDLCWDIVATNDAAAAVASSMGKKDSMRNCFGPTSSQDVKLGPALGIKGRMNQRWLVILAGSVLSIAGVMGQSASVVDTAKLGPQVGAAVPAFAGIDQFGKSRTLASTYGPKGAMLVFFRSADW